MEPWLVGVVVTSIIGVVGLAFWAGSMWQTNTTASRAESQRGEHIEVARSTDAAVQGISRVIGAPEGSPQRPFSEAERARQREALASADPFELRFHFQATAAGAIQLIYWPNANLDALNVVISFGTYHDQVVVAGSPYSWNRIRPHTHKKALLALGMSVPNRLPVMVEYSLEGDEATRYEYRDDVDLL